jgi:Uma2 family endonuclease
MATEPKTTGLTYQDLLRMFPEEDNLRRELIGGELIVTASPSTRHQDAVAFLVARLYAYAEAHGGRVSPAPLDVYFSETDVVEPDVLFVRAENLERREKRFIRGAPDIVVEVSSPSTRRLELRRKRDLYEREGVPEYWYVDLDADRVEIYRLEGGRYPSPRLLERGDSLTSDQLPGLSLSVERILALD